MTSRERVQFALQHREPDRVPVDLGSTSTTGMHVSTVYLLRQALGLDEPGTPVKVIDCYQMLGEIGLDLVEALGIDVIGLMGTTTVFGFKNEDWKEWELFDGTPVLVPGKFNTRPEPTGEVLMYPEGDTSAPPSGKMPKGGWYFDILIRQPQIEENKLKAEDNLEEFGLLSDSELRHFQTEAERLYTQTDKAIVANFGGTSFGNIARLPGPSLKYPKGIRDIEEWYVSLTTRPSFIYKTFEKQCEIALQNLSRIYDVIGNRIAAVFVTGTDFGAQEGPLVSPKVYRDLFFPFHKTVNDWIHQNTPWKTFIHSCGSVTALLPDFIRAGFDILNPVQCSATCMQPADLKERFGDQIVFWGGGVDTQRTLPFGTPDEVCKEVEERLKIFTPGGGYVFNPVHNVQAQTPIENVTALFRTVHNCGSYSF